MDSETVKEEESILEEGPESSDAEDSAGAGTPGTSGGGAERAKQQRALYIALGVVLLAGLALLILGLMLGGGNKAPVAIPSPVALQTPGVQVDPKLASVL